MLTGFQIENWCNFGYVSIKKRLMKNIALVQTVFFLLMSLTFSCQNSKHADRINDLFLPSALRCAGS